MKSGSLSGPVDLKYYQAKAKTPSYYDVPLSVIICIVTALSFHWHASLP